MMPSANRAMRDSPPPEKRFSRPRMFEAAEGLLDVVDRRQVDARHGDVRAQPVDQQHPRREGDLLADVRDLEGV